MARHTHTRGISTVPWPPLTSLQPSPFPVQVLDYFKLPYTSVLVVVDETALDLGQLRLRKTGTAGGHNGLKSIEAHLKTRDYARLRVGVGAGTCTCRIKGPVSLAGSV